MKKSKTYVKNKSSYNEVSFEVEKTLNSRRTWKTNKKPTSVALEQETIDQLKQIAEERGIPYQVLMRSYILKGLKEDIAY
ncbi:MAG: hypothetical protein NDI69_15365 [Bacteriovoracaceae bacterium]|nr:hypothetical protein [Bacteriovoracaceae bacterium]